MNVSKMFSTIDTHVAGKAFRIVTQSPIRLNEKNIKENNDYLQSHFENEKNLLLNEPRGHQDMHGCIVIPSNVANIGLLFFNHAGREDFTYSGLIAVITALLETGNIAQKTDNRYVIETAYGLYPVKVFIENGEVRSVYLESKEANIDQIEDEVPVVKVDGERTYLLYQLPKKIPAIDVEHLISINNWGREMCASLQRQKVLFDGVILVEEEPSSEKGVRSVTFEKDGNILRSPGVDSTIALLASKVAVDGSIDQLTNESIFGSELTAKAILDTNRYSVQSEAFVTGLQDFIYDETDPLKDGFLLK